MKALTCVIDDRTWAVLQRLAAERGISAEILAAGAIEDQALSCMTLEDLAAAERMGLEPLGARQVGSA